jgi:hypothetical protein
VAKVKSNIKDLFLQGDYQAVVSSTLDRLQKSWQISDMGYILGSLCFLGRPEEAETLLRTNAAKLSLEQTVQARFFLGVGFTRKSDYAQARHYFGANRKAARSRLTLKARFYVFQGIGFYRYYCGKWRLALRNMEMAYESALRSHYLYGRVVSSDLRGHLLVQMGNVQLGLRILKDAQTLSHQMGIRSVAQSIEVSRAHYEAQFGIAPLDRLQKQLKMTDQIQDTYSHSSVLLEMARQLLLRGSFNEASAILDKAAQQIYSHQNRRQEVTLNLRFAYLSHLRNEPARALSYLQACKRALDPVVDHTLKLATLGMELKVVTRLAMVARQAELDLEIQRESTLFGGRTHQRIVARRKGQVLGAQTLDPLGRVVDAMMEKPTVAVETILKSGYLGFLIDVLPDATCGNQLYIDLGEDTVSSLSPEGIEHRKGLTPLFRQILLRLAQGAVSKSELITSVWAYPNYHPLQHDPVVYQAITSLRRLLGARAEWIQTTEQGYALKSGVELKSLANSAMAPASLIQTPNLPPHKKILNYRQLKFMRLFKGNRFVSVHDYKRRFRVSEITACRDLSLLTDLGLVLRIGKARATRYAIRGTVHESVG